MGNEIRIKVRKGVGCYQCKISKAETCGGKYNKNDTQLQTYEQWG